MKNRSRVRYITQAALIAALYCVLTFFSHFLGLASGAVQIRLSESLTALLYFTPAAVPGLFIGCLLSNFLTGGVMVDIILGSLATLIGAVAGYRLKRKKYLVFLPNIIANAVVIPNVLIYSYNIGEAFWYLLLTVGLGEIISCGIFGSTLLKSLRKRGNRIFG